MGGNHTPLERTGRKNTEHKKMMAVLIGMVRLQGTAVTFVNVQRYCILIELCATISYFIIIIIGAFHKYTSNNKRAISNTKTVINPKRKTRSETSTH